MWWHGYEHSHEFWWVFPLIFSALMFLCMFWMIGSSRGFCGGYFRRWRRDKSRISQLEDEVKTLKSKLNERQ